MYKRRIFEMENKNVEIKTETSLVTLPKMEFVFDSAKITPAKINKDMIDFEKAEEKVEKIEILSLGKVVKIGEPIMKVTLK